MCPSEVSDVERSVWQAYRDRGVQVFGIASEDPLAAARAFRDRMGLTFPVLLDEGGRVQALYQQQRAFSGTVYPQDWIIGVDGKVAYVNNAYELDEITEVLEAELARTR